MANIYAPYYRQVERVGTKEHDSGQPDQDRRRHNPRPTDRPAFEYYIQHYNDGRPFILAGHSQGSSVLTHLLAVYMKANRHLV